ncbi:Uncharacterised protein [Vibrio cholerae]|nr:Uncharacterised protein [Vibrio cholerae]CSH93673.1 Uncharacterised protein [Vibrio cholerae]
MRNRWCRFPPRPFDHYYCGSSCCRQTRPTALKAYPERYLIKHSVYALFVRLLIALVVWLAAVLGHPRSPLGSQNFEWR